MEPVLPDYRDLPASPGAQHSAWGLFGAEDSLGLMNLQSPDRVCSAAGLVRSGEVFSLNAPLDVLDPPLFGRTTTRHTVLAGPHGHDDVYDNFYPQGSSQWDSLAHVPSASGAYYNGATPDQIRDQARNTIDHLARRGVAGRGVLLDLEQVLAADESPGTGRAIAPQDLRRAQEEQGVEIRPGDILMIHTGYLRWYLSLTASERRRHCRGFACVGLAHTEAMAEFLWDLHVCAVVSDNPTLEVYPLDTGSDAAPFGYLHQVLIGEFGLSIGELWWLADLAAASAADRRFECMVTSAPLNMPGGIGSPANAVAIR